MSSSGSSGLDVLTSARQLALAGDLQSATALLVQHLEEDAAQPKLWLLLGDLLAGGARGPSQSSASSRDNPSGLSTRRAGRPHNTAGAAEAYRAAFNHGQRLGEQTVVEVVRENLVRLLRLGLGHSPSLLLESLWDTSSSRFLVGEARQAAEELKGSARVVACVIEGSGWEAVWLARHMEELKIASVVSVRGNRTAALLPFERSLAELNGVHVACCAWEDLSGHVEAAHPTAALLVHGSCLGAYAMPPRGVLAEVLHLRALLGDLEAVFVPPKVVWRGGPAEGAVLRNTGQVDVAQMRSYGLDYSLASNALRPSHAWVHLDESSCSAWEDTLLATLTLQQAWAACSPSTSLDELLASQLVTAARCQGSADCGLRAEATDSSCRAKTDAFVWWSQAEGKSTSGKAPSSAPGSRTRRTFQVALFGEWSCNPKDVLALPASLSRFRGYHVSMLNDHQRTAFYNAALRAAVDEIIPQAEPIVALDLGAGTGLLSMLLVKHAWARGLHVQVVAAEAENELAGVASQLLLENGMHKAVEVHRGLSTNMGPGLGLDTAEKARASLCVHEVFGSDPLSECVLPSLRHARRELLSSDCKLVPRRLKVWCALCYGEAIVKALRPPASVEGVRCMGEVFAAAAPVVEAMALRTGGCLGDVHWLTPAVEVAELDLWELPLQVPVDIPVSLQGPKEDSDSSALSCSGVVVASWFSLDGPHPLSTGPEDADGPRPWAPVLQLLPDCRLPAGNDPFLVELTLRVLEDRLRFRLVRVALQDSAEPAVDLSPLFAEDEL